MITITGVIGGAHAFTGPHGLVTGIPVNTAVNTTLKIAFGINSAVGSGFQFFLCAGSMDDFNAHSIGMQLGMVTEPGYQTLAIIDTDQLADKVIYVLGQGTGLTTAAGIQFTINVE